MVLFVFGLVACFCQCLDDVWHHLVLMAIASLTPLLSWLKGAPPGTYPSSRQQKKMWSRENNYVVIICDDWLISCVCFCRLFMFFLHISCTCQAKCPRFVLPFLPSWSFCEIRWWFTILSLVDHLSERPSSLAFFRGMLSYLEVARPIGRILLGGHESHTGCASAAKRRELIWLKGLRSLREHRKRFFGWDVGQVILYYFCSCCKCLVYLYEVQETC